MFLVVKYHIIRPPPPAWARLLNKPKSQKIVGHWISKNVGLWISKNSWTMNFEKIMDHEFPKIVGHWFSEMFGQWYFLFEKFEIFKNLRNYVLIKFLNYRFCVIFWNCWFCLFCRYFGNLWKRVDIYFSYSKYIILQCCTERIYSIMRNN